MRRRDVLAGFAAAAASLPVNAPARQQTIPVIGFLGSDTPDLFAGRLRAFHEGLRKTGFVEGRDIAIEYRWAEGLYERLSAMADDLVGRRVAVIVANGVPALTAKAATTTIPIVFSTSADPIDVGLVASLSRPGGNVTGVSNLSVELGAKQLEVLHELVPAATIFVLLVNPAHAQLAETQWRDVQAAARALGLQLHVLHASVEHDLDAAFASLPQLRAGGLVIGSDAFFTSRANQIVALAARHAVPTVYLYREFVAAGGLMSYGGSLTDAYRTVGIYTGRILKGEKPAGLPVQQSRKIELIINLKAARTLGLSVPRSLLVRADELFE
jgi:putative tryptophan/tyrosine transport system substrate-binding protein